MTADREMTTHMKMMKVALANIPVTKHTRTLSFYIIIMTGREGDFMGH